MQNGIHFIAGLPRSGSTLLAAILRQNPRFHAGMTSPVGAMYMALEGAMSRKSEAAVFIDEEQRRHVLKGLFTSYYHALHETKVVFDTNRAWCTKLPAITQLFPEATMGILYEQLGEAPYAHNFDNVEYEAEDFDLALGSRGLHTVRRKVEWIERQSVLPPELFNRFTGDAFWQVPEANIHRVPII